MRMFQILLAAVLLALPSNASARANAWAQFLSGAAGGSPVGNFAIGRPISGTYASIRTGGGVVDVGSETVGDRAVDHPVDNIAIGFGANTAAAIIPEPSLAMLVGIAGWLAILRRRHSA